MRDLICHAPFVSLEFDPFGDVQACCANALFPLGNVERDSLETIWRGARAAALRDTVSAGDLTLGCSVCRYRLDHAGAERPFESYEAYPVSDIGREWPARLSFSLANTCNLECVMCGSDRSSRIRSRRAHLPPIVNRYGEAFFEQLRPFLERAEMVDFVGGESLLIPAHFRVWDELIAGGLRPRSGITTNGTVWNARVERVLSSFDTDVRISMDGMEASTFEAIRLGASMSEVLENIARFREAARGRDCTVSLNWSFLQQNWFELGDVMLWAEELGLPVNVMSVIEDEFGAQNFADRELGFVIESMERQDDWVRPWLRINRESWERQLDMLRGEVTRRADGDLDPLMRRIDATSSRWLADRLLGAPRRSDLDEDDALASRARIAIDRWNTGVAPGIQRSGWLTVDARGVVVEDNTSDLGCAGRVGVDLATWLGGLGESMGGDAHVAESTELDEIILQSLFIGGEHRDKQGAAVHLAGFATRDGVEVLLVRDDRFLGDRAASPVVIERREDSPQ